MKGEESRECVWGGESELGQVMLAYSVISFFCKYSLFLNWCDLMLFLLVLEFMHVCIHLQVFLSWTIPMTRER